MNLVPADDWLDADTGVQSDQEAPAPDQAAPAASGVAIVDDDSSEDEDATLIAASRKNKSKEAAAPSARSSSASDRVAAPTTTWRPIRIALGVMAVAATIGVGLWLSAEPAPLPTNPTKLQDADLPPTRPAAPAANSEWVSVCQCAMQAGPDAPPGKPGPEKLLAVDQVLWPLPALAASVGGALPLRGAASAVEWHLRAPIASEGAMLERAAARACVEAGGAFAGCADRPAADTAPKPGLAVVEVTAEPLNAAAETGQAAAASRVDPAILSAFEALAGVESADDAEGMAARLRSVWNLTARPPAGAPPIPSPPLRLGVGPEVAALLALADPAWEAWLGARPAEQAVPPVRVPALGEREDFVMAAAGCRAAGEERHGFSAGLLRWASGTGPLSLRPGNGTDAAAAAPTGAGEAGCARVGVRGATVWGALRGVEAAAQLLRQAALPGSGGVHAAAVVGFPWRWWRGLLVDTARHFMPLPLLARHLAAMGGSGLNVMHWHVIDGQSFPLAVGPVTKWLAEGGAWTAAANPARRGEQRSGPSASRPGAPTAPGGNQSVFGEAEQPAPWTLGPVEVRAVLAMAADAGVRVVPELDIPAHCASWAGSVPEAVQMCPELLARKQSQERQTPLKTLDTPALDPAAGGGPGHTEALAAWVLEEAASVFPDAFMHLGGDEMNGLCWQEGGPSAALLKRWGMTPAHLQVNFTIGLMRRAGMGRDVGGSGAAWGAAPPAVAPGAAPFWPPPAVPAGGLPALAGKVGAVWQEALLNSQSAGLMLPPSVGMVHPWIWWDGSDSASARLAASQQRGVVWSAGWYLDVVGSWTEMYQKGPVSRAKAAASEHDGRLVWGGEASMWAEQVDRANAQCRVWPRAAAIGERLWTPPGAVVLRALPPSADEQGGAMVVLATTWKFDVNEAGPRLARHGARLRGSGRVESARNGYPEDDEEGSPTAGGQQGAGPGSEAVVLTPDPSTGRCSAMEQLVQRAPRWPSGRPWAGAGAAVPRRLRILNWNVDEGGKLGPELVPAFIRQQAPDIAIVIEAVGWRRRRRRLLRQGQGLRAEAPADANADADAGEALPVGLFSTGSPPPRRQLGPGSNPVLLSGFANAATLRTKEIYRIAVMSAGHVRTLWSDPGRDFERGVLAVETLGAVVVAAHLNAHSAPDRAKESDAIARLLPALRQAAVRRAGPGERRRKWGCQGDTEAALNACAARVPVFVSGDMNTLTPLDADCHVKEGLLDFLRDGKLPQNRTVQVPPRLRAKYLDGSGEALDYEPIRVLMGRPSGPPPPMSEAGSAAAQDPSWWSGAVWPEGPSDEGGIAACDAARLAAGSSPAKGPLVDLQAAAWLTGAEPPLSPPPLNASGAPSTWSPPCSGSQPTAESMLANVDASDVPPFRLDFILAGPPAVCGASAPSCSILQGPVSRVLSDHFPIMCALSL
ncbi:hypothetical protein FNF27_06477 [Cafeteria roenbergensis]|uniref:beta-N-acetylhexosaminidase n=2 Tax=Cafeteria roenbergensis TaxID=33653 RepID=A0A5A8E001_CAFRO|nr:hypothetical protein FNF27_06477 [Cafeteria roenbergensis]